MLIKGCHITSHINIYISEIKKCYGIGIENVWKMREH